MATTAAERREKLRNRTAQSVTTREQKGLGKKSILDWSRWSKKRPPLFVPATGKETNTIDFLPWVVTQSWYKHLRTFSGLITNMDVGDWDYKLEMPLHKNVGENNDTFLCLRLAFGGKCTICDAMFEEYEKRDPDEKVLRNLKPTWRCWYNIFDYNAESTDDEMKIWEDASYHNFEKLILEAADEGEDGVVLYSDIEQGKTVEFKCRGKKLGKSPFSEIISTVFLNRDPYEENIVKETISFDALVKIPTYEEVTAAFLGIDDRDMEISSADETEIDDYDRSKPDSDLPPMRPRSRQTTNIQDNPVVEEKRPKSRRFSRDKKNESDIDVATDEDESQCPSGLTFGSPEDCEKCNACPDVIFEKCSAFKNTAQEEENKKLTSRTSSTATSRRKKR